MFGETPNYGANGTATTTTATGVAGISVPQPSAAPASAAPTDFPTVVAGIDGWLYYGTDQRAACNPTLSAPVIAQRFQQLSQIMQRAGKQFVMMIAPDKTDIYPEYLPTADQGVTCTSKAEAALWAALAANPPGRLPGSARCDRSGEGERSRHPALPQARHALERPRRTDLRTAARPTASTRRCGRRQRSTPLGDSSAQTDLEALLGQRTTEQAPLFSVTRPGVTTTVNTASQLADTTTGAPLITPKTLFISDSFTDSSRFAINPFFAQAGFINSSAAGTAYDELVQSIKSSQIVVLEIVERTVIGGQAPLLDSSVLAKLAASLGEG